MIRRLLIPVILFIIGSGFICYDYNTNGQVGYSIGICIICVLLIIGNFLLFRKK